MSSGTIQKATKRSKHFTPTSAGAVYLVEQFKKFDSNPSEGIDHNITDIGLIRAIYNDHPIFLDYSIVTFPVHFKRYGAEYKIEKTRKREGEFVEPTERARERATRAKKGQKQEEERARAGSKRGESKY